MAKEAVKKVNRNRKGEELKEYPKLIRVSEYTKNDRGQAVAKKILVQNEEEEKEVIAKHGIKKSAW